MTPSTRATAGQDTVASLRARLARLEREAASRQRQLEAYAADLREVFKQERAPRAGAAPLLQGDRARARQRRRGARRLHGPARRSASPPTGCASPTRRASRSTPQVEFGFLLHDVGKVAVPDAILFKPGPLTARGARADDRAPRRSARRSCATSTSSTTRRPSCAITTSAGTAPATPTGSRARRSPPRAGVRGGRRARRADHRPALPRGRGLGGGAREIERQDAGTQFDPAIVAAYDTIPDEAFARIREGIA